MKLHHLAITLSFIFTGALMAQSGGNGPAPSFLTPTYGTQNIQFQQELDSDNLQRLSLMDPVYKAELVDCLAESETSLSSFEEAEELRLRSQQEELSQQIRLTALMLEETSSQPTEEGMQSLSDRETILDQATLALLETQLQTVNQELITYGEQIGSWEALVLETDSDVEPIQWLVQAETGRIR